MIQGREVASDPFSSASDNSQTNNKVKFKVLSAHIYIKKKGVFGLRGKAFAG